MREPAALQEVTGGYMGEKAQPYVKNRAGKEILPGQMHQKRTGEEDPLLSLCHVDAGYNGKPVLEDVCIDLFPGRIVTVIGPNGSGKSTLLKTAAGQLMPVRGQILLKGRELTGMKRPEIAQCVAVVLTEKPRADLLTCFDIVAAGRYPYTGKMGVLTDNDKACVRSAMELVGLWDIRNRYFSQTSDGQKQMISLARAICQQPDLLILDEPTSFLDISKKVQLLMILKKLTRTRHMAVFMSLHELDLAMKISDRVLAVRGGKTDREGSPQEIFTTDYIGDLYDLEYGWFDPASGAVQFDPFDV